MAKTKRRIITRLNYVNVHLFLCEFRGFNIRLQTCFHKFERKSRTSILKKRRKKNHDIYQTIARLLPFPYLIKSLPSGWFPWLSLISITVDDILKKNNIYFSRVYCPYCTFKRLLKRLHFDFYDFESQTSQHLYADFEGRFARFCSKTNTNSFFMNSRTFFVRTINDARENGHEVMDYGI